MFAVHRTRPLIEFECHCRQPSKLTRISASTYYQLHCVSRYPSGARVRLFLETPSFVSSVVIFPNFQYHQHCRFIYPLRAVNGSQHFLGNGRVCGEFSSGHEFGEELRWNRSPLTPKLRFSRIRYRNVRFPVARGGGGR